jgi:hypothetical protein
VSEIEQEVEAAAAVTAAYVAEDVAEVVAEAAAADAVEQLAEQVIEHIDDTLAEIEDVVEEQEEDEQWLRLKNEIKESENRILSAISTMQGSPSETAEEPIAEAAIEALAEAEELQGEAEAEVLEFDPEAVPEGSEEPASGRRRVRGLRRGR